MWLGQLGETPCSASDACTCGDRRGNSERKQVRLDACSAGVAACGGHRRVFAILRRSLGDFPGSERFHDLSLCLDRLEDGGTCAGPRAMQMPLFRLQTGMALIVERALQISGILDTVSVAYDREAALA